MSDRQKELQQLEEQIQKMVFAITCEVGIKADHKDIADITRSGRDAIQALKRFMATVKLYENS